MDWINRGVFIAGVGAGIIATILFILCCLLIYFMKDTLAFIEKRRFMAAERRKPPPPPPKALSYLLFFDWQSTKLTDRARQIIREAGTKAKTVRYTHTLLSGQKATNSIG